MQWSDLFWQLISGKFQFALPSTFQAIKQVNIDQYNRIYKDCIQIHTVKNWNNQG